MKNIIKASIVTVVFNEEKSIAKTIESVINQAYDNYKYIVVDEKFVDDTYRVMLFLQSFVY